MTGFDLGRNETVDVLNRLLNKSMYFSELERTGKYSNLTLQKTLKHLLEHRLAEMNHEKLPGRGYPRTVYSLTERGRQIALKLKEISLIADSSKSRKSLLEDLYQTLLIHVNVMDNLVRVQDGNRIAEVYLKEIQGNPPKTVITSSSSSRLLDLGL